MCVYVCDSAFLCREIIEDIRLNGIPALERIQLSGSVAAYELALVLRYLYCGGQKLYLSLYSLVVYITDTLTLCLEM